MKGFKGTPFPWFRDQYGNVKAEVSTTCRNTVPVVGFALSSGGEAEANTNFILAAQNMYDALAHIAEYWNQDQNETAMADALWHIIETAEIAMAKARGEKV